MSEITRVGVDLAKQVIQVHPVNAAGAVVGRRPLKRGSFLDWCAKLPPGCLVAMEACSGAHHWARQLAKLGLQVRLIAPHLVAPYRMQGRTGKNDANDAAAVCEAASRPQMHFVPVKDSRAARNSCRTRHTSGLGEGPHRLHQPHSRAAGGVRYRDCARAPQAQA